MVRHAASQCCVRFRISNNRMLVMKANNVFVLCVAALSLSACASASGPGYLQTVSTAAIAGDQSELIIYRPSGFTYAVRTPNIEVNGMPTCDLPQGGFFRKNVSPGTTTIATSFSVPICSGAVVRSTHILTAASLLHLPLRCWLHVVESIPLVFACISKGMKE